MFLRWMPLGICAPLFAFQNTSAILDKLGHSHFGESFDTGPREKPWVIEGIGVAHFPITTKNPEVPPWFDQGHEPLHSFWDYEVERSFRWRLKLEPDNAMAYWGLARASTIRGGDDKRGKDMIRDAVKREGHATERERLYIDSLAADLLPDTLHEAPDKSRGKRILETLVARYPDDMEARALDLAFLASQLERMNEAVR